MEVHVVLILHEVTERQSQCCSMLFKNIQVKMYFLLELHKQQTSVLPLVITVTNSINCMENKKWCESEQIINLLS